MQEGSSGIKRRVGLNRRGTRCLRKKGDVQRRDGWRWSARTGRLSRKGLTQRQEYQMLHQEGFSSPRRVDRLQRVIRTFPHLPTTTGLRRIGQHQAIDPRLFLRFPMIRGDGGAFPLVIGSDRRDANCWGPLDATPGPCVAALILSRSTSGGTCDGHLFSILRRMEKNTFLLSRTPDPSLVALHSTFDAATPLSSSRASMPG